MKLCAYCNTGNEDGAKACTSCGGNLFKYKCGNCGTVFDSGLYCPSCGVKAGSVAKKCANCGAEYYSNACPNCGYTDARRQPAGSTTVIVTAASPAPVKKRKTGLWVLGWIFIFPLPLTILMLRNHKLKTWLKIAIIAAAWLLYLLIALGRGVPAGTGGSAGATAAGRQAVVVRLPDDSGQPDEALETAGAFPTDPPVIC